MIHEFGACPECDMPCSFTMHDGTWICNCECKVKPTCEECGFPIDPDNEVHPAGAECICDLKEDKEMIDSSNTVEGED